MACSRSAWGSSATTSSCTCWTWAPWQPTSEAQELFEGRDRASGALRWTATRVDLAFGSHSQLRALAEVYAQADGQARLVRDFVAAWVKVMELDRFDRR
jgi:catalase-peroxidase